MITYTDFGRFISAGDPAAGGEQIPKDLKCPAYVRVLAEVDAGAAEIVAYEKPSPSAADREAAKAAIDEAAEDCRRLWITPGSGQAMVYLEKRTEAERYIASGGTGDYPVLSASVGVEAEDLAGVAALVVGTTAAWTGVAASIERLRLTAKKSIGAATTWAEIDAASTVDWPTP